MKIAVASGKGGTGKTTVAIGLFKAAENSQIIDCDVEEPNVNLFLKESLNKIKDVSISVPKVDADKCLYCGKCARVCEFGAISVIPPGKNVGGKLMVFEHLCKGCLACIKLCPKNALYTYEKHVGTISKAQNEKSDFTEGRLDEGSVAAPLLIRKTLADIKNKETAVIDCPPGASCSMTAAVKGADFCVLVTEPTPFGLNDLEIAVKALEEMKIPFGVVINKSGNGYKKVNKYCEDKNIEVLMEIPFDIKIAKAYSSGEIITDAYPEYKEKFLKLLERIVNGSV